MNYEIPFSAQFPYLSSAAPRSSADWLCQKYYPGHPQKQILGLPEEVQPTYPQWASKGNSCTAKISGIISAEKIEKYGMRILND